MENRRVREGVQRNVFQRIVLVSKAQSMSVYGSPTQFDLDLLREAERTLSGRRDLDRDRVRNAYSPLQPAGVGSSGESRSESRNVSPAHTWPAANTSGGVSMPAGIRVQFSLAPYKKS